MGHVTGIQPAASQAVDSAYVINNCHSYVMLKFITFAMTFRACNPCTYPVIESD